MTDSPEIRSTEEQDESWAAFEDVPTASSNFANGDDHFGEAQASAQGGLGDDDDEWNDFEFASVPTSSISNQPPDIAQNFESAVSLEGPATTVTSSQTQLPLLNPDLFLDSLLCDLGQILNKCLRSSVSDDATTDEPSNQSDASCREPEANDEQSSCDHYRPTLLADFLGESDGSRKSDYASDDTMAGEVLTLWTSLRLIEEAAALKYQWGESKIYDQHLQALRMDLKLAKMRNPKLPAYAWQLSNSALTPEKPVASGSAGVSLASTISGDARSTGGGYMGPDSLAIVSNSSTSQNGNHPGGGSSNGTVVSPVQFDWSSSGLSNPLCEGVVDSGSMDLDYFSVSKPMSSSPSLVRYDLRDGGSGVMVNAIAADAWKNDLKLLGVMSEDDSTSSSHIIGEISQSAATIAKSNANSASLLEKLMNSNHRTATSGRLGPPSVESALSVEARRLLDTLPDLSFMVSPVLMFPIREDLGRSDGGDDVQL